MVTFPTSKRLVTACSNTSLILAPATAFTSGGTATGSLFCSRVARRNASKKTSARQRRIGKTTGTGRPRNNTMALTKDFRETIRERAQQEPKFRKALLREAIELILPGDEKRGRAILRNYITALRNFGSC